MGLAGAFGRLRRHVRPTVSTLCPLSLRQQGDPALAKATRQSGSRLANWAAGPRVGLGVACPEALQIKHLRTSGYRGRSPRAAQTLGQSAMYKIGERPGGRGGPARTQNFSGPSSFSREPPLPWRVCLSEGRASGVLPRLARRSFGRYYWSERISCEQRRPSLLARPFRLPEVSHGSLPLRDLGGAWRPRRE